MVTSVSVYKRNILNFTSDSLSFLQSKDQKGSLFMSSFTVEDESQCWCQSGAL